MATTNPVFQVLVTKGNLALLAAGQTLSNLQPGQLGLFNYHTNLAIDGTNIPNSQDFYIAVGIDRDGDGTTDDVLKSAGQVIQRSNVRGLNVQCYKPDVPKVIEITNFKAKCETDYGIKIEIRNQLGYLTNGYNQVAKSFVIKSNCCNQEDCTSCPEGDCIDMAMKLVANINEDQDNVVKAELIDYTTTPGTSVVITDPVAWKAIPANADLCLGIRVTSIPMGIRKYCSVNLGYFTPRGTDILISTISGFECNGTVTVTQDLEYQQGLGYDIAQLEYEAGGWNGKPGPYRTSQTAGVPLSSFESYVTDTAHYTQFNIIHDQFSVGGWLEYLNNLNTILVVPCADTTTVTSLTTVLDRIFSGTTTGLYPGLTVDAGNCDCTGVPEEEGG